MWMESILTFAMNYYLLVKTVIWICPEVTIILPSLFLIKHHFKQRQESHLTNIIDLFIVFDYILLHTQRLMNPFNLFSAIVSVKVVCNIIFH